MDGEPEAVAYAHPVLIADDSATVDGLKTPLSNDGYRVRVATNGMAITGEISAGRSDLVTTDVWMPILDSGEIPRRLREWNPSRHP